MVRPSGNVGREYELDGLIFEPGEQELGERRVDWDFILRRFGFYFPDAPADDSRWLCGYRGRADSFRR
jgi:hypothetical protein